MRAGEVKQAAVTTAVEAACRGRGCGGSPKKLTKARWCGATRAVRPALMQGGNDLASKQAALQLGLE